MNILGVEVNWRKKAVPQNLQGVNYMNGHGPWWGPITESFAGAWQENVVVAPTTTLLAFSAVYACVTGIASDVAKMRIKLDRNQDGIWREITAGSPWLAVLRKPNQYQTRIKFYEQWIVSKLLYGNAYILKQRDDARGLVTGLYVLHPHRVTPLVSEDGSVYYEIDRDDLSKVRERVVVPASEIIHDMMVSLWHPLIGVSPIYACGTSATMGNKIQSNSTNFFSNRSMPGGMLTAPGAISNETAGRLKAAFESNFSGANIGKLFVAGDALEFKPYAIPANDAQLIEQLKWTVEDVARAFHYPLWKLGGPMPPYTKPEMAMTAYYSDCLQIQIESVELCLDEGLALPSDLGTEFDLDNLMRMDIDALFESNKKASGWMKINEMRNRANLEPVPGGDSPYLQEQNFSLEALAKRDATDDPFKSSTRKPAPAEPDEKEETQPKHIEGAPMTLKDLVTFETELEEFVNA